jgi:acyl-[acyl-carrier-protein]-phospholipid O-acyltransferase/long-chain-fatty-acid--[acyl-carrier-protein] ligase
MTWAMPAWLNLSQLTTWVAACLVVPFLIFSPLSGRLAVKYSKQDIFRWCKIAEFPIVLLACIALWNQWILLCILSVFIMGVQSCLYSPSKYGLIRDIGGEEGIAFGSGMFETMAFLGILIGTVIATLMADHSTVFFVCVLLFLFAISGYLSARSIKAKELPVEHDNSSSINPVRFLKHSYLFAKQVPKINLGVFGVSMFWLMGGMLQMNLVIHCKLTLSISTTTTGIIMALAAIGIASGCILAGKLLKNNTHKSLILIGLIGKSILFLLITLLNPGVHIFTAFIFLIALMGGLIVVPCLAQIQQAKIGRKLGDMIAYLNFITFLFVLTGALIFWLVTYFTNENSIAVFVAILVLCLFTTGIISSRFKVQSSKNESLKP